MRYEGVNDWARDAELLWAALDWITSQLGWADDPDAVEAVSALIDVLARPIANKNDHYHRRHGAAHSG